MVYLNLLLAGTRQKKQEEQRHNCNPSVSMYVRMHVYAYCVDVEIFMNDILIRTLSEVQKCPLWISNWFWCILWCFDVCCMALGAFYRIENNGLRLLNTQRNDSGYYRCLADNRVSSVNRTARIRVEGLIQILFAIAIIFLLLQVHHWLLILHHSSLRLA